MESTYETIAEAWVRGYEYVFCGQNRYCWGERVNSNRKVGVLVIGRIEVFGAEGENPELCLQGKMMSNMNIH